MQIWEQEHLKIATQMPYRCIIIEVNGIRKVLRNMFTCLCAHCGSIWSRDSMRIVCSVYWKWAWKCIWLLHCRVLNPLYRSHQNICKIATRIATRIGKQHLGRSSTIHCGECASWMSWRWKWNREQQLMNCVTYVLCSLLFFVYFFYFLCEPVVIYEIYSQAQKTSENPFMMKEQILLLKLLHRKYDEQDVSGMLSRFQHLCLMPIITSLHKYDYIMETTCKANWIDFRNIHFWSYDRGFRQNSAKSFLGLSWAYICQKFTPSYDRIQIIILQKTILI